MASKTLNARYTVVYPEINDKHMHENTKLLLEEIMATQLPIILVFDEIDYITPSCPMNDAGKHWILEFNTFWRNLRVVYQECSRLKKPFSLLISGVSSKWFKVESIQGTENQL